VCRKAKYILKNTTPKIKQPSIQLAISQFSERSKVEAQTNIALLQW
jgi:hypothetical protein